MMTQIASDRLRIRPVTFPHKIRLLRAVKCTTPGRPAGPAHCYGGRAEPQQSLDKDKRPGGSSHQHSSAYGYHGQRTRLWMRPQFGGQ